MIENGTNGWSLVVYNWNYPFWVYFAAVISDGQDGNDGSLARLRRLRAPTGLQMEGSRLLNAIAFHVNLPRAVVSYSSSQLAHGGCGSNGFLPMLDGRF